MIEQSIDAALVGESDFRSVSEIVPEFGGYYFDASGRLVVLLTDETKLESVAPIVRQILQGRVIDYRRSIHGGTAPVVSRRVTYSFQQLKAWRDAIIVAFDRVPSALTLDLDEVRNRVAIGVRPGSNRLAVASALSQLMVPASAVLVEEVDVQTDVAVASVSLAPGDSLTSYNTVVKGGMRVNYYRVACSIPGCGPGSLPPGEKVCSFGLGVQYGAPAQSGFLTASHCSEKPGDVSAQTSYHQPFISGTTNTIGAESVDPSYTPCPGKPQNLCRNSDALFAVWDAGAGARVSQGRIARTTYWGTPYGSLTAPGSVIIDQANPEFTVTGEPGNPVVGEATDKMGHMTGWTGGPITNTCYTTTVMIKSWNPVTAYDALCQVVASYTRNFGDSGGSVFKYLGNNNVLFMGLHMGGTGPPGGPYNGIFSPIHRIRMDFPNGLVTTG